ncbi:MAG: DUF2752 domain-containing protein [Planctomycetota bacterium]
MPESPKPSDDVADSVGVNPPDTIGNRVSDERVGAVSEIESHAVEGDAPMATLHSPRPARNAWYVRGFQLCFSIGLVVLLVTAACLQPSARGMGTHHQLGLPPCTSVVLFGIRCPACGMTTSWAYFMNANPISSISVNAGGFLLALMSVCVIPLLLYFGISGHRMPLQLLQTLLYSLMLIIAITAIDWTYRLMT